MRLSHEDIKELLPDYLSGSLPEPLKEGIESHLKVCDDCESELSFLKGIVRLDVPDPGDLFWKTLPQRIKVSVRKERAHLFSPWLILFRPLPVAATLAVLVLLAFLFVNKRETPDQYILFSEPLPFSVMESSDMSGISEKDIPFITGRLAGNEISLASADNGEYSYQADLFILSSTEIEDVYDALISAQGIADKG